jgi:hypothetical protein
MQVSMHFSRDFKRVSARFIKPSTKPTQGLGHLMFLRISSTSKTKDISCLTPSLNS